MENVILRNDVVSGLCQIPSASVDCVVTSPPFFGLRDYSVEATDWPETSYVPMPGCPDILVPAWHGCLGNEPTVDMFVAHLVYIFDHIKPVLKKSGTIWLNLGDSYASSGKMGGAGDSIGSDGYVRRNRQSRGRAASGDIAPKNLLGIPWRVAFALQAAGWILRQDIIWKKNNAMPESVRDRCSKQHEYIFLLARSLRYYFDADAIKVPYSESYLKDRRRGQKNLVHHNLKDYSAQGVAVQTPTQLHDNMFSKPLGNGANKRSVWEVNTRPFKGAHFATFPPDLIRPCVLAGCPKGGIVLDPFIGSGTTGIVALETGRKFIGIEISPTFKAMADERIENKRRTLSESDEKQAVKKCSGL